MTKNEKKKYESPVLKKLEISNGKVNIKGKNYTVDQILNGGHPELNISEKKPEDIEIRSQKYLYFHYF